MKTLFIEAKSGQDLKPAVRAALPSLKEFRRIGLATTVQHIDKLDGAKGELEKAGKEVHIGELKQDRDQQGIYSHYPGQVLGCDVSTAISVESDVDCFLYIGTGEFHPLGMAMETKKPIITINPFSSTVGEISEQDKSKYLAKQAARLSKFKDSATVGILVSTKAGQTYSAERAREIVEKQGKRAVVFMADTIHPESLADFPQIDCWVNTACPRCVGDQERYPKTVVNIDEIKQAKLL